MHRRRVGRRKGEREERIWREGTSFEHVHGGVLLPPPRRARELHLVLNIAELNLPPLASPPSIQN